MDEMNFFIASKGLVKPKASRKGIKKNEVRTSIDISTCFPMDDMTIPEAVEMLMGWAKFLAALSLGAWRKNKNGGVDVELDGNYYNIPDIGFDAAYYGGGFMGARLDCSRRWETDEKGKCTTTITVDDSELAALFTRPGITLGEIAQVWAQNDD